ncbi:MAG: shikimate kinase [Flavobacteriales bacterium]|nr:shikimate kinase [Flavobacteriales bacterium]|tara:strand:+ start:194 stop:694 length:501 start_codon:yes stop_codon:yes gene_type:complete
MKYFLVGFMGSGKSYVGKKLSEKLQLNFIDLDHYIEQIENRSILDIFNKEGEDHFRKLELKYFTSILKKENTIISTGGGTPTHNNIMKLITESGTSFYLKCKTDTILKRLVKSDKNRPLIKDLSNEDLKKFIEVKLSERSKFYEKSDYIVNNNSKEAIIEIINLLR